MQFLRKLLDRFNRFMYGRFGADTLFYVLFGAFFVLNLAGNLFRVRVLWWLSFVCAALALFRYYSRNLSRRREENRKFLAAWGRIRGGFTLLRDRVRDRKVCRYRRCKSCRAVLRLPVKRGRHSVVCPRCGKRRTVRILF